MILTAQKDISLDNDYVDVKYRELTPTIHRIFQVCDDTVSVLLCEKDNAKYKVDVNDVLYIEAVDRKSCVYTSDEVYIMQTPLNQLEEILAEQYFVRISKMALANIFKITSISDGLHYRLTAEMVNGEKVVISRHYRNTLLDSIQKLAKEVVK